jgi:hypothetical protein
MKGSIKLAEAVKVVEICKKIKQEFPKFDLKKQYLDVSCVALQKIYQIRYDYKYFVDIYNKLNEQKRVHDYFETEEGKALKLQMEEYIKEAKKNKKKVFSEYHKIFSDIVKTEFGKDFSLDKDCYDLKIAHKDTIKYFYELNTIKGQKTMLNSGCCFGKMSYEHPFVERRFFKEEIIVETFGFEFMDLSKNDNKKTELFIKTAEFLNNKELQNKISALFKERREKLDLIYKIIETSERKLKNPLENENRIS